MCLYEYVCQIACMLYVKEDDGHYLKERKRSSKIFFFLNKKSTTTMICKYLLTTFITAFYIYTRLLTIFGDTLYTVW